MQLSDLLSSEEAHALKDLVQASHVESKSVPSLTVSKRLQWTIISGDFESSFLGEKRQRCSGCQGLDHYQSGIPSNHNSGNESSMSSV